MTFETLKYIHKLLIAKSAQTLEDYERAFDNLQKWKKPGMASEFMIERQTGVVELCLLEHDEAYAALCDFQFDLEDFEEFEAH